MARSISTNVSNNPLMTKHEHGSGDFYADMAAKRLPSTGVFCESEGDCDHLPPRVLSFDPAGLPLSRGPRIPLILISPFARAHVLSHEEGYHSSVIKLLDSVFNIPPLADLPDELRARLDGEDPNFNGPNGFKQTNLGSHDRTPGKGNVFSAFDPNMLEGEVARLPASFVETRIAL